MALAALAPTTTDAAQLTPAGKAKGGPFSVHFAVVREGGRPVAVRRFRFLNLPITCDQGEFLLSSRVRGRIPVEERRFRALATEDDPPSEARIRGRFVTRAKVKGRLGAEGSFEGVTNCAGGRRFTAS